jgi:hypothetical protein
MKSIILKAVACVAVAAGSSLVHSVENDHLYPNITDFELPYINYRMASSAQVSALKGQKEAGASDETLRADISIVSVGLKKERVDNRYSFIDIGYGTTSNGELDYTNSAIEIQNLYSFRYGEGRHIGRKGSMDWNIYVAAESADLQLGFETKSQIGAGIGGELAYSITSFFDIKGGLHATNIYQGLFVGFDINF